MKKLLTLLLICMAGMTYATVFVNQNSNGGIEYTDTPTDTSQKIDVPAVNSISTSKPAAPTAPATPTTPPAPSSAPSQPAADAAISTDSTYQSFEIASPKNEENIQNQAVISVSMTADPNIKAGDKIQLMLDGKPVGTPVSALYQELGLVERGAHTLYAEIINSQNQAIKRSSSLTIYVHRNSAVTSPAMRNNSN